VKSAVEIERGAGRSLDSGPGRPTMERMPSQLSLPLVIDSVPDYSVRVSARARRLQLRVLPLGQVEVVVPRGLDPRHAPAFVQEHADWLRRTLAEFAQRQAVDPALHAPVPERIELQALGECWTVEQRSGRRAGVRVAEGERRLDVAGADARAMRAALRRWLSVRARAALVPWLGRVSAELGLSYNRVSIRAQKSRWGSCSARGDISLNRSLLFLPPPAVRHLLVHELCHTVHLNHSRRFWALVARHAPDFEHWEHEIREAGRYLPAWSYAEPDAG